MVVQVLAAPIVAGKVKGEISKVSVELFQYDFVNLTIKILAFFLIAIAIDKLHFLGTAAGGAANTIASLFGYNIGAVSTNTFFTKLFGEGYFGLKYWDFVKILAIVLVFIEFMRYYQNEKTNGGSPSPFTIAIFTGIILLLSAFTIPEIISKLRARIPSGTVNV